MDYASYIGKQEEVEDTISLSAVQKIEATLQTPIKDSSLPFLWQWCFFIKALSQDKLGRDGHPKLGGDENSFLPYLGDVNRMWAGGRFEFLAPLTIGKAAKKVTTIKDIKEKTGQSGKLIFVTLMHEYIQDSTRKIIEEQDIVYKEPSLPKLTGNIACQKAEFSKEYMPNETTLFRYSALTFNGHRIHYDYNYACDVEKYPGLVIHGPLLATYMIATFCQYNPTKQVTKYAYRGMHALCVPDTFKAEGAIVDSTKANVWINKNGFVAHQGEIEFK